MDGIRDTMTEQVISSPSSTLSAKYSRSMLCCNSGTRWGRAQTISGCKGPVSDQVGYEPKHTQLCHHECHGSAWPCTSLPNNNGTIHAFQSIM